MYVKDLKLLSQFDKAQPIFFDTETIGLYGRTRLMQLKQNDLSIVIDCFYINIENIKYFLKDCHLIGHNIIYDLSCIDFKRWIPKKLDDTMLLARIQWPHLDSHSLKSLCDFLKLENKGSEGSSDWSQYNLTKEQLEYAEKDTLFVKQIFNKITKETLNNTSYQLDIKSIECALEYQHKGLPIDKDFINKTKREFNKNLNEISKQLPKDLNVNSSKQVQEYLNIASSSKASLRSLIDNKAELIINYRETYKALNYLNDFQNYTFAYALYNPVGAKTGRFTCSSYDTQTKNDYFNLQQIPRKLKKIFAVKNGAFFVTADYPALEIWMSAAYHGDAFLTDTLIKGEDLHWATAEAMFNKNRSFLSKQNRMSAKTCNFTLLYGAGVNTLKTNLSQIEGDGQTLASQANVLRQKWLNTYKGMARIINENYEYFNNHKYKIVYTALGRPLYAIKSTEALNFCIQGSGAECTKLALYLLKTQNIIPAINVHDSIGLIASNEKEAKEYSQILKWAMEEAFIRVTKNLKVNYLRPKVETYIGESYD